MATLSVKQTLSLDPTRGLRAQLDHHGVREIRALAASIVARACHRKHFEQFGRLGAALGPIVPMGDGYRLNTDLGRIDVRDLKPHPEVTMSITVQFVGLEIKETNETYDEPYIVMGVVTLAPESSSDDELDQLVASQLIKVPGEDHPQDYVFADVRTIWRKGQLIGGTGIKVTVFAYEEDSGDPDEVAEAINKYLREKAQQGAQAIAGAYSAGAGATAIANAPELQWFFTVVSLGLAGWIGDDEVGFGSREIPMSELRALAQLSDAQFAAGLKTGPNGMKYNYDMPVHGDGRYRIYFRVSAAEMEPVKIQDPPTP